jgi:hypothetical protein
MMHLCCCKNGNSHWNGGHGTWLLSDQFKRSMSGKKRFATCTGKSTANATYNPDNNEVWNSINNAINGPINNAAKSVRKRALALAAAASNPLLCGITRLSDAELTLLAAALLRRPDVSPLFARGSHAYVNVFQWTAEDEDGWAAKAASLTKCERKESLSHVFSKNPPLWVLEPSGRLRKINPKDIFYEGSGAYIIRLAISPLLCDITEVEKIIHVTLSNGDVVGFKGHVKNGGSPARQQSYVYGVSMLVIPNPAALGLVVRKKFRTAYELELLRFGGREGRVVLPAAPPVTFALPPLEAPLSSAFVLGGTSFLLKRGLISSAEAAAAGGVTARQDASQGASQDDDEASIASWGGDFGDCIYFSGKRVATCGLSGEQIEAMGGERRIFASAPSEKNQMTLLVVQATSNWRKGPKYNYAIANNIPIITFEQLAEALDGEEEEEEEEDDGDDNDDDDDDDEAVDECDCCTAQEECTAYNGKLICNTCWPFREDI